jgi:hypothetical protein
MLIYADSSISREQVVKADICIVGSGAAGISLAHHLLATNSGKRILILEGSRQQTAGYFTDAHRDVLQRYGAYPPEARESLPATDAYVNCTSTQRGHRFWDPVAQELYEGTEDEEQSAIDPEFLTCSRLRVYGGTTNCWGGWTRTLTPLDFNRSDLGPLNAWPIDRDALFPSYYKLAMEYCSLNPVTPDQYDDPSSFVGHTSGPIELMPLERQGILQNAGFTYMDSSRLDFQQVWGPDLERAPSEDCLVVLNANVRTVEAIAGGTSVDQLVVTAIDYGQDPPTPKFDFYAQADAYVLATGGTESSRLLLSSASGGLGNSNDNLGRYFMFHPLNVEAATFSGGNPPSDGVYNAYSNWGTVSGSQYPPHVWVSVTPTDETLQKLSLRNFRANVGFYGTGYAGGTINMNWEQEPNPNSRIVLAETTDPIFGDPLTSLEWQPTPNDTENTPKTALELVQAALEELGYLTAFEPSTPYITWDGDHHMGATRMSATPEDGYVDSDCKAHELDNLYIASSSVFTTCGYANPTLTIIALALRLADHLSGG